MQIVYNALYNKKEMSQEPMRNVTNYSMETILIRSAVYWVSLTS